VSPQGLLNADGTLDLTTGFQGTLDLRGWEVTLDGERGPVFEPASVSAASTSGWSALRNGGLNGNVYALAVVGSDLYVGGAFTQTVDGAVSDLGHIARYHTPSGTWHALPKEGVNDEVYALLVMGDDLYVGGRFTQTGDGTVSGVNRIARYDTGAGTWHALPRMGLNGSVYALTAGGVSLHVGGTFTQTGDGSLQNLGRIASYSTMSGTWYAPPNGGLNGTVNALVVMGSDLYVGGTFTQTGDGSLQNLGRVARYSVASWHALPNQGLSGTVNTLAVIGSDLYVGGAFGATGDWTTLTNLGNIARYDPSTSTWHALDNQGLDSTVRTLLAAGSNLYVGGQFTQTGDGALTGLGRAARYDTAAGDWHALSDGGLDHNVYALALAVGSDLYVGGAFAQAGDGTVSNLGHVARYDISPWHGLPNRGLNNGVGALAAVGSDLYVGGSFVQTGDGTVPELNRIARYDTAAGTWHALPNSGLSNSVHALAVVGGDLYVGGMFTQTSDGSLKNLGGIARYDTAAGTWHALNNQGLSSWVWALAVVGSDLYVGGEFVQTGDGVLLNLGYIARYDTNAGTWHALDWGLNSWVNALAVLGSDLYVGGHFVQTGDEALTNLGRIARYDTNAGTWHALPSRGLNNDVSALAVVGDNLYVGGGFTQTGDGTVPGLNRIARYNAAADTWHALSDSGLNGWVNALAVAGGNLYVGGSFTQTGGGALQNLGRIARYNPAAGTWHALPNRGLNNDVSALAVVGDNLYVGGAFAQTGDGMVTDLNRIARYGLYPHQVYLPLVVRQ
jgi:N-acetylneuraminic acid mutarotase